MEDAGENTTAIIESGHQFFASKNSIWNKTQTIVMLSHPYRLDHLVVLNVLKTMWKNINGSSVEITWPTPRDSFEIEAVKEIGAMLWVDLEKQVIPIIKLTRYNYSTSPNALTKVLGLDSEMNPAGIYLEINASENMQNNTGDIVEEACILLYYTASDLDKTGDGDANDVGDIDEKSLKFYFFDESTGKWIKITDDLDWVFETGIDTTNVELYGKKYEGYIWAKVSHFSIYGLAGNPIIFKNKKDTSPPGVVNSIEADASASEIFGFVNTPINFDGSLSKSNREILSYLWDFGDGDTAEGEKTIHIYSEIGIYNVELTVANDFGNMDKDSIIVTITIANNPPTKPTVNGPTEGATGIEYSFTAISEDEDINDMIRYGWDWDNDNVVDEWTEFHSSGETSITNHTFTKEGLYRIRAQCEDNASTVSEWSEQLIIFIDIEYLQQEDGTYLIDYEKDGSWDSIYDPDNDEIVDYEENMSYIYLFFIFIIMLVIMSYLILKRKKSETQESKKKIVEKDKNQNKKQIKKGEKTDGKRKTGNN